MQNVQMCSRMQSSRRPSMSLTRSAPFQDILKGIEVITMIMMIRTEAAQYQLRSCSRWWEPWDKIQQRMRLPSFSSFKIEYRKIKYRHTLPESQFTTPNISSLDKWFIQCAFSIDHLYEDEAFAGVEHDAGGGFGRKRLDRISRVPWTNEK